MLALHEVMPGYWAVLTWSITYQCWALVTMPTDFHEALQDLNRVHQVIKH